MNDIVERLQEWTAAGEDVAVATVVGVKRSAPRPPGSKMLAPVGLDLGGLSAEETALSIMAEVVAARHGRAGGMLSASGGRIHEVRT
jgi:xanthine/CO dehydrogenase XdhC/CoxF family maturation factor